MLGKSGCGQSQAKQGLPCCSHIWELTVSLLVRLRKKLFCECLALLSTDMCSEHTGLPVAECGAVGFTAGFGLAPSFGPVMTCERWEGEEPRGWGFAGAKCPLAHHVSVCDALKGFLGLCARAWGRGCEGCSESWAGKGPASP